MSSFAAPLTLHLTATVVLVPPTMTLADDAKAIRRGRILMAVCDAIETTGIDSPLDMLYAAADEIAEQRRREGAAFDPNTFDMSTLDLPDRVLTIENDHPIKRENGDRILIDVSLATYQLSDFNGTVECMRREIFPLHSTDYVPLQRRAELIQLIDHLCNYATFNDPNDVENFEFVKRVDKFVCHK